MTTDTIQRLAAECDSYAAGLVLADAIEQAGMDRPVLGGPYSDTPETEHSMVQILRRADAWSSLSGGSTAPGSPLPRGHFTPSAMHLVVIPLREGR